MTHPHDDDASVEHDPTGVRDLLSRLPEPGPMPDELGARITAALAAETDAARPASATPDAGSVGEVVRLPRRRAPRLRHLSVAAAVVTAVGVGAYGFGTLQSGLSTGVGAVAGSSQAEDSDSRAGSGEEAGAAEAPSASGLRLAPSPGSGEVLVVMSGREHAADGLVASARALADSELVPITELAAEAPGIGPIGTPVGARTCADALGVPGGAGLLVDVADVDGRPAAVLVVLDDSGRTAYAVDRYCTTGTTGTIRGPVSLD